MTMTPDLDINGTGSLHSELAAHGYACIRSLLTAESCRNVRAWFDDDRLFRSTVLMHRHGFGRGTYKYFGYPLPAAISSLRADLYERLAGVANSWGKALGTEIRYPEKLDQFLQRCAAAGQTVPTPLMLKYGAGDYNCLHQDIYGAAVFPLQAAIALTPRSEYEGGEFILTEQRPRMQTRAQVISLEEGDAVIFPVNDRPVRGTRGFYRVRHRHGVSTVTRGERMTLGIIFHDAAPAR
jgi:hypothetical protein